MNPKAENIGTESILKGALGVIEQGAYADIIIVDGNPLDDIELMVDPATNFKLIMKDGVIYKNTL